MPQFVLRWTVRQHSLYPQLPVKLPVQEEHEKGSVVGLDIVTGEGFDPKFSGVYDNYLVKRQVVQSAPVVASQLLLVDEVLRAGMNMRGRAPG